ncbi:MAG TPA: DUF4878 domain-containing protein [Ferruginibacter sp.]|nr:DUF4878 domain-containing protein [Ferruginibacter sp.]HMP21623.1 DUF4878 domain-containing protein [Ferruginibacter sp.]
MIKKFFLIAPAALFLLTGCNNTAPAANTDIDVATTFVKAVFKSDFKTAGSLLLQDSENLEALKKMEAAAPTSLSEEAEKAYKNADVIIGEWSNVSDTVSIISYSGSFNPDKKNKVKVVKVNGRWLIDLKYTFSGNL